jgi:hypothetical protein
LKGKKREWKGEDVNEEQRCWMMVICGQFKNK